MVAGIARPQIIARQLGPLRQTRQQIIGQRAEPSAGVLRHL